MTSDQEPSPSRRVALSLVLPPYPGTPACRVTFPEPKPSFLLRRVPTALVWTLVFVAYGFLIALLTMAG